MKGWLFLILMMISSSLPALVSTPGNKQKSQWDQEEQTGKGYGKDRRRSKKVKTEFILHEQTGADREEFIEIKPERRAADLEEAFRALYEKNPQGNIFIIVDGRSHDHLVDLTALSGGTMILVTTRSRFREREYTFNVEDVEELGQRKSYRLGDPVRWPASWRRPTTEE